MRRLIPYVLRYRGVAIGAAVSLVVAALTTLTLPLAVRRMIDHGFSSSDSTFIANYFAMLVVIAAVLAAASAARYYFVITLGERVVADVRNDVFGHVTTLSPGFFDRVQSGEIVSRLTADTTQIKSAVGASLSLALRNAILGIGAVAMMVITSPKLSGLVIVAIPLIVLPLVAFGRSVRRKSRAAQDMLAHASAYAGEQIGAIRTLQAFTNEKLVTGRFARAVETAFAAARSSVLRPGAAHLLRHLHHLRLGGGGAVVRLARRAGRRHVARHARPVPALFGVRGRRARRAVGDVGRTQPGRRRGGAADGTARPRSRRSRPRPTRRPSPRSRSVRSPSATYPSPIRRAPTCRRCTA